MESIEPVVDYPRAVAPVAGVKRYGLGYVAVAVAYGVVPLASVLYFMVGFGLGIEISWTPFFLVLFPAQFLSSFALLHGKKWSRVYAAVQSMATLVWLGWFVCVVGPGAPFRIWHWLVVVPLVLVLAEAVLGLSVLVQVTRSFRIDNESAAKVMPPIESGPRQLS